MTTHYEDSLVTLLHGDVLDVLRSLPDASVHCCVTSPPYWGLRDYGTGTWEGGDPECDHKKVQDVAKAISTSTLNSPGKWTGHQLEGFKERCGHCGAVRQDKQLGMEALHDCAGWATGNPCGECFICHMVQVFAEVKRVLRNDGTLWLNIGETMNESGGAGGDYGPGGLKEGQPKFKGRRARGLKPKDMCLIPSRLALALQADGWYVRSQIVWAKRSVMPESVQDRPTSSWEPIWLLTKRARYFYDAEAVREITGREMSWEEYAQRTAQGATWESGGVTKYAGANKHDGGQSHPAGRNSRNVWHLGPDNFSDAHFATFPREIPRRAIKAGTSERGCCPACGAPWKRSRVPSEEYAKYLGKGYHDHSNDAEAGMMQKKLETFKSVNAEYITTGWWPTCICNAGEPVPCVVLDPFGGSCTTAMVAKQLVRRAIAIDLNADYLDLGIKRVRSVEPGLQLEMW